MSVGLLLINFCWWHWTFRYLLNSTKVRLRVKNVWKTKGKVKGRRIGMCRELLKTALKGRRKQKLEEDVWTKNRLRIHYFEQKRERNWRQRTGNNWKWSVWRHSKRLITKYIISLKSISNTQIVITAMLLVCISQGYNNP